MALELFKPFVYRSWSGASSPTRSDGQGARRPADAEVLDSLEKVIGEHPVLLTVPRPCTASHPAFEPVLVEAKAIKIHPCLAAYNADFDATRWRSRALSPRRSSRRGS